VRGKKKEKRFTSLRPCEIRQRQYNRMEMEEERGEEGEEKHKYEAMWDRSYKL